MFARERTPARLLTMHDPEQLKRMNEEASVDPRQQGVQPVSNECPACGYAMGDFKAMAGGTQRVRRPSPSEARMYQIPEQDWCVDCGIARAEEEIVRRQGLMRPG